MNRRFDFAPIRWVDGRWALSPRLPPSPPVPVRIATWNVWFGEHQAVSRRRALLADLARRDLDVIALQEVTQELLDALLAEPWVRRDYWVSELQVISYDVIILSRVPVHRIATIPLPSTMGRRLIVAELTCGLDVATIHLESTSLMAAVRAAQLAIILEYLATRPDAVLVGDMNFAPEADLENRALDPRFLDLWPALRPSEPGYTADPARNPMRAMTTDQAVSQRIDRMFARTPRWTPRHIELLGTDPLDDRRTFVSDHFGLALALELAAASGPTDV